ncbi:hypothetical protein V6Z11_A02G012000 [Gossypium hirsutum]
MNSFQIFVCGTAPYVHQPIFSELHFEFRICAHNRPFGELGVALVGAIAGSVAEVVFGIGGFENDEPWQCHLHKRSISLDGLFHSCAYALIYPKPQGLCYLKIKTWCFSCPREACVSSS